MKPLELVSHDLCPFAQRAVIALTEKGVAFKQTHVDLDNRPQWFKLISPLGKVPLLRVRGEVLFESAVIMEYLDETLAPALHPADPLVRARHRAWIEYASSLLMDNYALANAPDAAVLTVRANAIRAKVERLQATLGPGPYFAGEGFSLVDAAFAPFFRYWDTLERIHAFDVFERAPAVVDWRVALARRASVCAAFDADFDDRLARALARRPGALADLATRKARREALAG